jgi:hypothetical protein
VSCLGGARGTRLASLCGAQVLRANAKEANAKEANVTEAQAVKANAKEAAHARVCRTEIRHTDSANRGCWWTSLLGFQGNGRMLG